jgi:hypothetical protein
MRQAQRKGPDTADGAVDPASPAPTTLVRWIYDSPVCVEIVDSPPQPPRDGVCRCQACHAACTADWAARFLP